MLILLAVFTACSAQKPVGNGEAPMRTVEYERLQALAAERAMLPPTQLYRIGPGDLLEISVFDIAELTRKERVTTGGHVQLPLIGPVKAAGLTEAELATEIAGRLGKDFVYNPQVDVFVAEYKSQQVAVTGAVEHPGLYPLPRERRTILDMLAEAGGLTKDAGSTIELIPAEQGSHSAAFDAATVGLGLQRADRNGGDDESLTNNAITIGLNDLLRGSAGGAINVVAIAGDVIFVPDVGSFTIEGWVDRPGTYPLTRQTTVLAAMSAGGGTLFPARLGKVEILRNRGGGGGGEGSREAEIVDIGAIRDGKARDVALRSGDIIRVPAHWVLVPPWYITNLGRELFRVGANLPIP